MRNSERTVMDLGDGGIPIAEATPVPRRRLFKCPAGTTRVGYGEKIPVIERIVTVPRTVNRKTKPASKVT